MWDVYREEAEGTGTLPTTECSIRPRVWEDNGKLDQNKKPLNYGDNINSY